MRKIKLMIMSFVLILGLLALPLKAMAQDRNSFPNIDYSRGNEIRVILEGEQLDFDVPPQLVKGRVLVPMRKIFESFGLNVTWDASLQAARGRSASMDVVFPIGSNKAEINGMVSSLDVPAQIIQSSTMVPLRFLSEHMDYNIVWNSQAQLILLSQSNIIEWRYKGFESVKPYKEYEVKYINGINTKEVRYTGENHDVSLVNLYKKDGSLIPNVPDFKVKDYVGAWSQSSSFSGETYWVHIDVFTKAIQNNPIYLEQDLQPLSLSQISQTSEAGNYVKVQIHDHYFDLATWKRVIGRPGSELNTMVDEAMLDEQVIGSSDSLFKVEINDSYHGVIAFDPLNQAIFNRDPGKLYTVLEKSPETLFNWDANTWKRLEERIPWTGMTQDMLLIQFKQKPDQTSKLTTKFNHIELWVYTEDYGDSIYYFKDGVLINIL